MDRSKFVKLITFSIPTIKSTFALADEGPEAVNDRVATTLRTVRKVLNSSTQKVSAELTVRRALPASGQRVVDPFVLMDIMGPVDMQPGEGAFVPPHPHRGFEPVTILFEGSAEHKDSLGNHARLDSGDVQWMTAGAGIVHSEDMGKNFVSKVRRFHGIQLWVNLPKAHKDAAPGYQNISAKDIPVYEEENGKIKVRVIAGEFCDLKGPAKTFTPITALHLKLGPGAVLSVPLPGDHNALVQVLQNDMNLGEGKRAKQGQMVLYNNDGEHILITTPEENTTDTDLLLLAGKPINEPIYAYGPFVMTNKAEIKKAYADYQAGKMGKIDF